MEAAEYIRMAAVQDRHWWFEAKRRTVAALLARHTPPTLSPKSRSANGRPDRGAGGAAARVLEVGPGTGSMIEVLSRYGRVHAADAYLPALRLLVEQRPARVLPVGADLLRLPFADAGFTLVGCFDVLYHQRVGDVGAALSELYRVTAPGGHLAITDSAFPLLRSSHDVATHAARRFRLADLTGPLRAAGFTVEHATYFHTLLFPAALAVRLAKRLRYGSPRLGEGDVGAGRGEDASEATARPDDSDGGNAGGGEVRAHSDLAPVPGWLNALLLALYRFETPLAVRWRMPFGSSLLILARRPLR